MTNPKTIISILSDRGFDSLKVEKELLNKELRSTSTPLRDWLQQLAKRTTARAEATCNSQAELPFRKPITEFCAELLEFSSETVPNLPTVAKVVEDWITTPSPEIDWHQQFTPLVLDTLVENALTTIETDLDPEQSNSCSLLSRIVHEKNGFILRVEHFTMLTSKHVRRIPEPTPFRTLRAATLDVDSTNESLRRQEAKYNMSLDHRLRHTWSKARLIMACLPELGTVCASIKILKWDMSDLPSFEEVWSKGSNAWKKKGTRKDSKAPTVEDADSLFAHWMTATLAHSESFQMTTLRGATDQLITAFTDFRNRVLPTLEQIPATNCPFADNRVREAIKSLRNAEVDFWGDVEAIHAKAATYHESLIDQLASLKSHYEKSTSTVFGRLERCASRDWKTQLKDFEARQRHDRHDIINGLHQMAGTSAPIKAALLSVAAVLAAGEAEEVEALREHRAEMKQDAKLQEVVAGKKSLAENVRDIIQYSHLELSRILARMLLAEGERLVAQGGKGSRFVDQSSKSGKKKNKKKAATENGASVEGVGNQRLHEPNGESDLSTGATHGPMPASLESPAMPSPVAKIASKPDSIAPNLIQTLQQRLADQAATLQRLEEENSDLREKLGTVASANGVLREGVRTLEEENERLREGLRTLEAENGLMRDGMKKLSDEVKQLKEGQRGVNGNGNGTGSDGMMRGGGNRDWRREGNSNGGFGRRRYEPVGVRCANCGLKDHQSADCKAPCRYCNVSGHLSEDCPSVLILES